MEMILTMPSSRSRVEKTEAQTATATKDEIATDIVQENTGIRMAILGKNSCFEVSRIRATAVRSRLRVTPVRVMNRTVVISSMPNLSRILPTLSAQ
mmetsp:Transcript_16410/g.19932  ORF Transcript_16410/g.19932 Transcript_16410/m.19932 type:complete len:96 (-) Transcript_16410:279-566(-)